MKTPEQRWRAPALTGLQLMVGTGLQGKALSSRVVHALRSMKDIAEHAESPETMRLLQGVQQYLPSGAGAFAADVEALSPQHLNLLARAMCEFFLVAYAEERSSKDAPPEPSVIWEG